MINQTTIETPRIAAPGEAHLACLLLLDTSASMAGAPIESLCKALSTFKQHAIKDPQTCKRVDIAIMQFDDDVNLVQDFVPIIDMKDSYPISTGGCTEMGKAILAAIDKVKERNRVYAKLGTPCYQPWIFMITDGAPTDDISEAAQRIAEESQKGAHGKLKFWSIGVPGYRKETFTTLSPDGKRMIELNTKTSFEGIFNWLSESIAVISVSQVGETPSLSPLPSDARKIENDW